MSVCYRICHNFKNLHHQTQTSQLPLCFISEKKLQLLSKFYACSAVLTFQMVSSEQVKAFFASCGEVRSVRMAGDEIQSLKFAFVEFASVESAQSAMQLNGAMLGDRPVK